MKTSVRTTATNGTNANLIYDLMRYSGTRLILSAGYLTWFEALPFNEILNSVDQIDLVVGVWRSEDRSKTALELDRLKARCDDFVTRLGREASEYGIKKPCARTFIVPNWHAKVAMMVAEGRAVSAAVIGSSNLSHPALGNFMSGSNVEADVLIGREDGPDAHVSLQMLLDHLEPVFVRYPYVSSAI